MCVCVCVCVGIGKSCCICKCINLSYPRQPSFSVLGTCTQCCVIERAQCNIGESIAIGGISGAIAQGTIYPMEVIQTRLAISPAGTYRGILDAFAKIVRQEGYFALFRWLLAIASAVLYVYTVIKAKPAQGGHASHCNSKIGVCLGQL